jgi:hypothetical protein
MDGEMGLVIHGTNVASYINDHRHHNVDVRLLHQNAIERDDPAAHGEPEREG